MNKPMRKHIRANLWLLGLTLLLCSVVYPLVLLGAAQTPPLHAQAEGSLLYDQEGKAVGSQLIGQNFTHDEYFQPRPSATSPDPYNAEASGASNYAASNPALRARVAEALRSIVKYKGISPTGNSVQKDYELWSRKHPGEKFDAWLRTHPDIELEPVPADLVMASASGLDPHITLANALYQLDRVADKWAQISGRDKAQVRTEIEELLHQHAAAPLGGLVGVELVNVLEVNLALHDRYQPGS
jgi:K+-transporting ATPase ATPase C chain